MCYLVSLFFTFTACTATISQHALLFPVTILGPQWGRQDINMCLFALYISTLLFIASVPCGITGGQMCSTAWPLLTLLGTSLAICQDETIAQSSLHTLQYAVTYFTVSPACMGRHAGGSFINTTSEVLSNNTQSYLWQVQL